VLVTPETGVDTVQNGTGTPLPITAPQVCGDMSWKTTIGGAAVDISLVPTSSGAQALAVPQGGGALSAYALDKQMNLQAIGASLTIDDAFTAVSASSVRGYLVATAADASSLEVDMLANDLSKAATITKLAPGYIAKPAFQRSDTFDFIPVADATGLRLEGFDASWQAKTIRVATSEPATGMTAATMGHATVAAWATKARCYMTAVFGPQPGPLASVPEACVSPRLAIDSATARGQLVYEASDGIRMMSTELTSFVGSSQRIAQSGSAPRVLWDGHRFWISYLDATGAIVVGYLDGGDTGKYVSTMVVGPRPGASAYELAMIDGQVWVVSFVSDGIAASRLCIEST
jgi:hypothetical protein